MEGFDCLSASQKVWCRSRQAGNEQQSTGLLHLIGSNPTIANKKTTPKGGFLIGGDGGI